MFRLSDFLSYVFLFPSLRRLVVFPFFSSSPSRLDWMHLFFFSRFFVEMMFFLSIVPCPSQAFFPVRPCPESPFSDALHFCTYDFCCVVLLSFPLSPFLWPFAADLALLAILFDGPPFFATSWHILCSCIKVRLDRAVSQSGVLVPQGRALGMFLLFFCPT